MVMDGTIVSYKPYLSIINIIIIIYFIDYHSNDFNYQNKKLKLPKLLISEYLFVSY